MATKARQRGRSAKAQQARKQQRTPGSRKKKAAAKAVVTPSLWYFDVLDIATLWATSRGAGVRVAVLDSGVATPKSLPSARVKALDHAGKPSAQIHGSHGTSCAGLIAASSATCGGIAPEAKIESYRVTLGAGQVWPDHVAEAISLAASSGCDVINCSFVLPHASEELRDAVGDALGRGIVIVAASGNEKVKASAFPEELPGLVCVGATRKGAGKTQRPAAELRITKQTDVFAPGFRLRVPRTNTGCGDWDGETSGATAIVAGVVAVLLAAVPIAKRRTVGLAMEGLLKATADSLALPSAPGGRALLVNPVRALTAALDLARVC